MPTEDESQQSEAQDPSATSFTGVDAPQPEISDRVRRKIEKDILDQLIIDEADSLGNGEAARLGEMLYGTNEEYDEAKRILLEKLGLAQEDIDTKITNKHIIEAQKEDEEKKERIEANAQLSEEITRRFIEIETTDRVRAIVQKHLSDVDQHKENYYGSDDISRLTNQYIGMLKDPKHEIWEYYTGWSREEIENLIYILSGDKPSDWEYLNGEDKEIVTGLLDDVLFVIEKLKSGNKDFPYAETADSMDELDNFLGDHPAYNILKELRKAASIKIMLGTEDEKQVGLKEIQNWVERVKQLIA